MFKDPINYVLINIILRLVEIKICINIIEKLDMATPVCFKIICYNRIAGKVCCISCIEIKVVLMSGHNSQLHRSVWGNAILVATIVVM